MSMFTALPKPESPLARYRPLAPTASVRVSPLCLGTMNFGDAWKQMMGECNKETTFEILDYFYKAGGNFLDTANNYQCEESETWIGEWLKARGVRDQMVIATKYTTDYKMGLEPNSIHTNYTGNSHKSLHISLEASLKKLQTDYIDLLYVHWWDHTTSIEETMQALNRMVQSGKVLYLGISDTPAWIVSKANQYARDHGMKQFSVYQGRWNVAARDPEREILPMCEAEGMAMCPWAALGGGNFKTEEQFKAAEGRKMAEFGPSEADKKVAKVLEKLANARSVGMTSIALAYVMHQAPDVYPIVGGRKIEHLKGNIDALTIRLSEEELTELEGAYGFDYGFPQNFLHATAPNTNRHRDGKNVLLTQSQTYLDIAPKRQPFLPEASK